MPNKTITQIPVILPHIIQVRFARNPETGLVEATAQYRVLSDTGAQLDINAVTIPLTAGQRSALVDFIVNVVLPHINTVEGT